MKLHLETWQFFVTFLGWLSDLQLGDEKVILNHLEGVFLDVFLFLKQKTWPCWVVVVVVEEI